MSDAAMHLDLERLPLRGGERYECTYPVEMEALLLGGAAYQAVLPDGTTVTVDRVAGGFVVHLVSEAKVYGPCARCLKEVEVPVHAEQEEFAPTAAGGWEETETCAHIDKLVLDIPALTREAVVLALPSQVVCSVSCKGLCTECGEDLNRGPCGCRA